MGLRYTDVADRDHAFMDLTSLTQDEFADLLPAFDAAFQDRMRTMTVQGTPRQGRRFVAYHTCPLPTPADRLLFVLVYLKTNPIQTVHGALFGMPQNKTTVWIHQLLPVLQTALQQQGDAPARTYAVVALSLQQSLSPLLSTMAPSDLFPAPKTRMNRKAIIAARKRPTR